MLPGGLPDLGPLNQLEGFCPPPHPTPSERFLPLTGRLPTNCRDSSKNLFTIVEIPLKLVSRNAHHPYRGSQQRGCLAGAMKTYEISFGPYYTSFNEKFLGKGGKRWYGPWREKASHQFQQRASRITPCCLLTSWRLGDAISGAPRNRVFGEFFERLD